MKKLFLVLFAAILALPSVAFGVGTVTITTNSLVPKYVEQIIFTCVGDAAAGTIPNTEITQQDLARIAGMFLHSVTVDPGTTPPDAADVFIMTAGGEDLLGSADNIVAVNGLNLIHATLGRSTIPKTLVPNSVDTYYRPLITGLLTLKVLNQATVSANWTVTLIFTHRP